MTQVASRSRPIIESTKVPQGPVRENSGSKAAVAKFSPYGDQLFSRQNFARTRAARARTGDTEKSNTAGGFSPPPAARSSVRVILKIINLNYLKITLALVSGRATTAARPKFALLCKFCTVKFQVLIILIKLIKIVNFDNFVKNDKFAILAKCQNDIFV